MARYTLNDEHWSKLRTIMREQEIYDKSNLRKTVEEILYRMRVERQAKAYFQGPGTGA